MTPAILECIMQASATRRGRQHVGMADLAWQTGCDAEIDVAEPAPRNVRQGGDRLDAIQPLRALYHAEDDQFAVGPLDLECNVTAGIIVLC